jgi:thiol-disulfide isomerase/thioredoxin
MTQIAVLGALIVATALVAVLWRSQQGRVRMTRGMGSAPVDWSAHGVAIDGRATFVQLSSAICSPCRATAHVLAQLAAIEPGVTHRELDVDEHARLVRDLGVLRTPTVLVLDAGGREVARSSGAMTPAQARSALDAVRHAVRPDLQEQTR